MKKHEIIKTIQLILLLALAAFSLIYIVIDQDRYHLVAENPSMMLVSALLWLSLVLSFIFILLDFRFSSGFKKDMRELDYAVHSDPLSGLANRLGADALIDSYIGKEIPENFSCLMMDISNIREVNEKYGHIAGNDIIRQFSEILNAAGGGLGYVARNGGNKFLAIFEDATEEQVAVFVHNVEVGTDFFNQGSTQGEIRYRIGVSSKKKDPELKDVTDMVALANRRIYEKV